MAIASPPVEARAIVTRAWRGWKVGLTALGFYAAIIAGVVGFSTATGISPDAMGPVAGFGVLPALLGAAWLGRARKLATEGRVTASRDGLQIVGGELFPRAALLSAVVTPKTASANVVIETSKGDPLTLEVESVEAGRAIVDALGLGVSSKAYHGSAASPLRASGAVLLSSIATLILGAPLAGLLTGVVFGLVPGLVTGILLYLTVIAAMSIPARVIVGTDAIVVRWLWQERNIALADVRAVEERKNVLRVHLTRGGFVDVTIDPHAQYYKPVTDAAATVAERIREAMAAVSTGHVPEAAALALTRGEADVRAWIDKLRALTREAASFREGAPPPERLWELVEDASAKPETRAAAAVAIGPTLDDAGKARLRVAAEACAAPRLRVALEAASKDDEAAIEEAMREVDDDAKVNRS